MRHNLSKYCAELASRVMPLKSWKKNQSVSYTQANLHPSERQGGRYSEIITRVLPLTDRVCGK